MPPAESFAVEVVSRTLVRASNPPQGFPAVLPVSTLDLILGSFHVFFIAIYPAPAARFPAVAAAARAALPAFLSRFYPFAGRVVPSASTSPMACLAQPRPARARAPSLAATKAGPPRSHLDRARQGRRRDSSKAGRQRTAGTGWIRLEAVGSG